MALTEAEELELLELEAAAAGSKKPKKKKPTSIARQGEAAVRGVTSGLLGVGDYAAAAGDIIGGQVIGPALGGRRLPLDETMERVRSNRRELEQEAPAASAAGNIAGALVPFSRAGQLANKLGFGLKSGAPVTNTLKTAATAGTQGTVTAANLGASPEEAAQAGGVSAVAGPAIGGLVRSAGAVTGTIRSALDRNKDAGFKALAKALSKEGKRVSPTELKERAAEFKRVTGRNPTVTEIVGERGGQDILETVQSGSRATERLLSAAETQGQALQGNLSSRIRQGKAVPAVSKLQRLRKVAADNAMSKLKNRSVEFDPESVNEIIGDREVFRALPADAQDALQQLVDSGGRVSVRTVEDIRQAFRKRGNAAGATPRKFREFADSLVEGASEQVPEYGRYLTSYGRRSEGIRGAEAGRRLVGTSATDAVEDTLANAEAPFVGGARTGVRAELVNRASKSPRTAAATAQSLAEDAGLARRLAAADPAEATRLRELGETETQALRNVASTVRGARVKSASQEDFDNAKTALETAILASGRASGAFQASLGTKLVQRFRVPPTAALRLAEALTDPARTDEAIERLVKAGIEPSDIEKLARAASQAAARTTGPATLRD